MRFRNSSGIQQADPNIPSAKPEPWIQPYKMEGSSAEQFDLHARNFLDCVKSRERPIADVEQGHQVTTACHLANISCARAGRFDGIPKPNEIVGDPEASQWLERPYRKPWDEVLRSFHL